MSKNRIGGTMYMKVDGTQYSAKGSWTYNLGGETRTTETGADGVHGYTGMPRAPFVEGAITDSKDTDVKAFQALDGVTITLELANGKVVILQDAWYAGEGNITTEAGEIAVRFDGKFAEEDNS